MKTETDYWNSYYDNGGNAPLLPSQFATFIAGEYLGSKRRVIDLGCGNGRDSLFFLNLGFQVIGIDASTAAIESIKTKPGTQGMFFCREISDLDINSILQENNEGAQSIFYSRFFLHALSENDEAEFWRLVSRTCKPGDILALEFRTTRDEQLSKSTKSHYRRFINPTDVVLKGNNLGFTCEYFVEGFGYAKYKGDDAHVARIILSK